MNLNSRNSIWRKVHSHIQDSLPRPHESRAKHFAVWALLITIAGILAGLFVFTVAVVVLSVGLPDVRDFDKLAGNESTIIYDRNGGILYSIQGEQNRKYVPLSEISPLLQKATIAIEDSDFYNHSGFDVAGIGKAFLYQVFGIGVKRGGSTITQQLAKNAFLTPERAYTRKLKELILAIRLERAYDKNKILELYLNRIPYGNNAYGAELASKMYFGKSAKELTLAESVVLASMPQAPTFYSPYGQNVYSKLDREFDPKNTKLPETLAELADKDFTSGLIGHDVYVTPTIHFYIPGRADLVLRRMNDLGDISEEERKTAVADLRKIQFSKYQEEIRAPHFVFYVRTLLEQQFGKDLVAQGGLKVYSTIDPDLQDAAQQSVADQIKYSKDTHGASNGALFSINPKTGEVLAMIGSADYWDTAAHGNVNHVFAKRQPGSSFKPIMYAKAFLNRYSPATVLYDTPTNFGQDYTPQNYEGAFRGPMTIRQALGQSRNIPALKAYFLAGQEPEIVPFANKMGITSLAQNGNYGPPLAIGAGETTLAEMVQAFSVFANTGVKRNYFSIFKVEDRQGDTIYQKKLENISTTDQQVLDPQVAYLINSILSDKSVYLGPRLDVPGHTTAAKTGTSNKEITPVKILPSNLWTIGYTPSIVTGVWVGNSDGTPMKPNADGYNVAAPIWSKFMTKALAGTPDEAFPIPADIKTVIVSRASGILPSADTPADAQAPEVFASFAVPTEVDDIYKQVEVNDLDNLLPNEFTPKERIKKKLFMNHHDPISLFPKWLQGIHDWISKTRETNPNYRDFPPTETTKMFDAEGAKNQPTIEITSPASFSTLSDLKISVEVKINAPNGVDKVTFYLNERTIPNSVQRKEPYTGTIRFTSRSKSGQYFITAKVFDKKGYVGTAKIEVKFTNTAPADIQSKPPVIEPQTDSGLTPTVLQP